MLTAVRSDFTLEKKKKTVKTREYLYGVSERERATLFYFGHQAYTQRIIYTVAERLEHVRGVGFLKGVIRGGSTDRDGDTHILSSSSFQIAAQVSHNIYSANN